VPLSELQPAESLCRFHKVFENIGASSDQLTPPGCGPNRPINTLNWKHTH